MGDHIISTSNLHRTLTCVIAAVSPKQIGSGIKELMGAHFEVAVAPMRMRIRSTERRLIAEAEPCLNRRGLNNENTKRINQLCKKRKELGWFRLEFWAHVFQAASRMKPHPDGQVPTSTITLGSDASPSTWPGTERESSSPGIGVSPPKREQPP